MGHQEHYTGHYHLQWCMIYDYIGNTKRTITKIIDILNTYFHKAQLLGNQNKRNRECINSHTIKHVYGNVYYHFRGDDKYDKENVSQYSITWDQGQGRIGVTWCLFWWMQTINYWLENDVVWA